MAGELRRHGQAELASLGGLFRAWGLQRVTGVEDLADRRGSYLFLLKIPVARIRIGAVGLVAFSPGLYAYVGSAKGRAATLAHRLRRHLRREKTRRWHIDYVTTHPGVAPVAAYVSVGPKLSEERLARLCARRFPVIAGFGNSDLRGRTPGHLFLLQPERLRQRRRSKRVVKNPECLPVPVS